MTLATAAVRLDEEAAPLSELISLGPLTAAEATLVGEAVLARLAELHAAGEAHGDVRAENVLVSRSGSVLLVGGKPAGRPTSADLAACGQLLSETLGDDAAPALLALVRSLASGRQPDAEQALSGLIDAAGGAAGEPARLRARLGLRLRTSQVAVIPRVERFTVLPAPPARPARRQPRPGRALPRPRVKVPRPRFTLPRPALHLPRVRLAPTTVAVGLTALLVVAFVLAAARLPASPPTIGRAPIMAIDRPQPAPRAASPDQSVKMFFQLAGSRRFDEAAQLWTPRLRGAVDPTKEIGGRFGAASQLKLTRADVVAIDQNQGIATVAVAWTDVEGGTARGYSGEIYLATGPDGWRWDKYAIGAA